MWIDHSSHESSDSGGAEEYQQERDLLILAQNYFALKEFDRVVFVLKGGAARSPTATFLRLYAEYLVD